MFLGDYMKDLLAVAFDDRDEKWEENFFKKLPGVSVEFLSDSPIEGPDGMAYLAVKTVDKDGEPADKVLVWLGEKGVGLVVNPNDGQPDYVFSYGMIWNFLLHGEFISDQVNDSAGGKEVSLEPGQEMMAGTPSEEYLPPHVRGIFKEYLSQQSVDKPKIVMLSQDGKNYDMCFSLESLGNPPQEEWQGILEAFSWFFPLHYSFSILSEEMIQGIEFTEI